MEKIYKSTEKVTIEIIDHIHNLFVNHWNKKSDNHKMNMNIQILDTEIVFKKVGIDLAGDIYLGYSNKDFYKLAVYRNCDKDIDKNKLVKLVNIDVIGFIGFFSCCEEHGSIVEYNEDDWKEII